MAIRLLEGDKLFGSLKSIVSPQLFIDKQKKANKHRMELHSCICHDDDDVISPSHPHTHISSAWKLTAGNN